MSRAAVFLCLLAASAPAQAAETPAVDGAAGLAAAVAFSDTLIVSARPVPDPLNPSLAGLITRIHLAEESPFRDAADLLGSSAGFQVRRLGAVGGSAVPSLRGSAAAQIRFFLDGMPLNEAQTGVAGLDRIPLDRIEAIEIHRGVVPSNLGGIGGAGAVNFRSRQGDLGTGVLVGAGSFGERSVRAVAGLANGEGTRDGTLVIHGRRADNDFTYLDNNQTFHNAGDDTLRTRRNAWIEQWGAFGTGTLRSGRLESRFSLGHDRRDGGRPGPLGYPSPHAAVRYARTDGQLHVDLDDGLLQLGLAAGGNEDFLYDPAGEVGLDPPGTNRSVGRDAAGRLVWAPDLAADRIAVQAGVEGQGQRQDDWIVGRPEPRRQRTTWSAFAAVTADPVQGRLQAAFAWRWQRTRDDFPREKSFFGRPEKPAVNRRDDVSPSVGLIWTAVPERLFLEAHAVRTVRQPNWMELFGQRGGIDGNLQLQAEDITSADAAVSYRSGQGRLSVRAAFFFAGTDDKIVYIQNSQRTSKAINAGRARARGVELELSAVLPGEIDLTGNLTLQRAEDRGGKDNVYEGNQLPFLPDTEAMVRVRRTIAGWRPWLEAAHLGSNYRDRANTELNKAAARTILGAGVARDWPAPWLGTAGILSVSVEAVNLTDNTVYDVEGYPLPGRSWHLAVRMRR